MGIEQCIENLIWRGLIHDASDIEGIKKLKDCSFYCGFDPTASSLHIGNFIPITLMTHLSQAGLKPMLLFGGATGSIGDPSGRSSERQLLEQSIIEENISKQQAQVKKIFDRIGFKPEFINNWSWTKDLTLLDFLRDIGKHFTVNYMMAKDSVNNRMEGDGISYTEFSYMLLQAYDFYHLYQTKNCRLQVGASDQWGNITAGLELIRRKLQGDAYAMCAPLLLDSAGKKLGKSTGGGVWLDPTLTSPFKFHQFWLNIEDSQAIKNLKLLSQLDAATINQLEESQRTAPEKREAQKALADNICNIVHGETETVLAKKSAEVLFGGSLDGIPEKQLEDIFQDVPSTALTTEVLRGMSLVDLFTQTGLVKSRGDAKRLITNGGAYLNNQRISDAELKLDSTDALQKRVIVLRSGKKSYHLVKQAN